MMMPLCMFFFSEKYISMLILVSSGSFIVISIISINCDTITWVGEEGGHGPANNFFEDAFF